MSGITTQVNRLYKQGINVYTNLSSIGKILIILIVILIVTLLFKNMSNKEYFEQQQDFLFKTNPKDIYDDAYASVYDYLTFDHIKNEYEIGAIINSTKPNSFSKILDIGSGNGHHVANMSQNNLEVMGIDISPSMIKQSKKQYPKYDFKVADASDPNILSANTYTHILCLQNTIYYFKNKFDFFKNCMKWLMPGGYLIVHIIDRDKILNNLTYNKKLFTNTNDKYISKTSQGQVSYSSDFKLDKHTNTATFTENIKYKNNNKIRTNKHTLYVNTINSITQEAMRSGLILHEIVDLLGCQYEYEYLYIFTKPN